MDGPIYAGNVIGENALQFNITQADLSNLKGQDALFIDSDKRLKNLDKCVEVPEKLETYFDSIEQLDPIIIKLRGKAVRKFWVYKCSNYKGSN